MCSIRPIRGQHYCQYLILINIIDGVLGTLNNIFVKTLNLQVL